MVDIDYEGSYEEELKRLRKEKERLQNVQDRALQTLGIVESKRIADKRQLELLKKTCGRNEKEMDRLNKRIKSLEGPAEAIKWNAVGKIETARAKLDAARYVSPAEPPMSVLIRKTSQTPFPPILKQEVIDEARLTGASLGTKKRRRYGRR